MGEGNAGEAHFGLSMGHLREEPKVGKGRYQGSLERNKQVTIKG